MTTRHRTDRHHLRVGDQTMRQPPRQATVELAVALQGTGRRSCRSCQGPSTTPQPTFTRRINFNL